MKNFLRVRIKFTNIYLDFQHLNRNKSGVKRKLLYESESFKKYNKFVLNSFILSHCKMGGTIEEEIQNCATPVYPKSNDAL